MNDIKLGASVEAVQNAFRIIADKIELPDAVVTVQRQKIGGSKHNAHGWTSIASVWKEEDNSASYREIVLTAESMSRTAPEILGTLLHECAHLYNMDKEIRDCDQNGRHNKKFKNTAEIIFGLKIAENSNGWSETSIPDNTVLEYKEALREIIKAKRLFADGGNTGGSSVKGRNKNLPMAQCNCGNKLRASQQVLLIGIRCEGCDSLYA